jgi:RHS repeat-associated protein
VWRYRVREVQSPSNTNPFGRRIQKVFTTGSTTTTTNYLYDGDNDVEEVDASGTILARYTQGENIDEPLAESRLSTTSFYEADGLGSVTSLTNSSGAIADSYTYDSFGKLTSSTGSVTNPFQYTGRDFDSETGLPYFRARYYDPSVGRFVSEDSSEFAALDFSLYSYVGNGPPNFRDPTGFVRIDPGFPKNCLSNLNRAIQILRRAAQKNPNCNCQYVAAGGNQTLQQLLDTPDITIHYDPVQNNTADPEEGGIGVGYTIAGDTSNIWLYPYACREGRWTIASNLAHELMHITLTPGPGQEDAARQAQVTCGFGIQVLTPTITVRP